MEQYRISFRVASQGLLIPRSLEIVVPGFASDSAKPPTDEKATPSRQDDGRVESRLSAAMSDSCTRGVLDFRSGYGTAYAATSTSIRE